MILTKIELGEVDPDEPGSGIQYGDFNHGGGGPSGAGRSLGRMDIGVEDGVGGRGKRRGMFSRGGGGGGGMNDWEEIFAGSGAAGGAGVGAAGPLGRRGGCC